MSVTSQIVLGFAIVGFIASLLLLLIPDRTKSLLLGIPRNYIFALVILVIDAVWVVWLINSTSLQTLNWIKPYLMGFAPIAVILIAYYMKELLSPRVIGGLLLLAGVPILDTIRWHDSNWRFVVTITVYVWAVAGMALVLSPYYLRKWTEWFFENEQRLRFLKLASVSYTCILLYAALVPLK